MQFLPSELPESIYSNISIMTLLLKQCCTAIKKRKNQNEYPYTVKKKVPSTFMQKWDQKNFTGTPFHSTSFACASIELELNPCTYREEIRNVCIIINGGKILKRSHRILQHGPFRAKKICFYYPRIQAILQRKSPPSSKIQGWNHD